MVSDESAAAKNLPVDAPNEGEGAGAPADGHKKKIKVLAMLNDPEHMQGAMNYLERNNYEVNIVRTVAQAFSQVIKDVPDVLLISWSLKLANVKKVYHLFTNKFRCVVIAFAEDSSASTAAGLLHSGLPHTLLPPVSGPAMHMRIQAIVAPKRALIQPAKNALKLEESLPHDLKWAKSDSAKAGADEVQQFSTWRGESADPKHSGKVFFFKGPEAPSFDPKLKKWNGVEAGKLFIAAGGDAKIETAKEFTTESKESAFTQGLIMEEKPEQLTKSGIHLFEKDDITKTGGIVIEDRIVGQEFNYTPTDTKAAQTWLENMAAELEKELTEPEGVTIQSGPTELEQNDRGQVSKKSAGNMPLVFQEGLKSRGHLMVPTPGKKMAATRFGVSVLKGDRHKGFVYTCNAQNSFEADFIKGFTNDIVKRLAEDKEKIEILASGIEVEVSSLEFIGWAKSHCDHFNLFDDNGKECALAFLVQDHLPELTQTEDANMLSVSVTNTLMADTTLNFDLYLKFEKNHKFIHYKKAGQKLDIETFKKLMSFKVKDVYIRREDVEKFYAYCAKTKLRN